MTGLQIVIPVSCVGNTLSELYTLQLTGESLIKEGNTTPLCSGLKFRSVIIACSTRCHSSEVYSCWKTTLDILLAYFKRTASIRFSKHYIEGFFFISCSILVFCFECPSQNHTSEGLFPLLPLYPHHQMYKSAYPCAFIGNSLNIAWKNAFGGRFGNPA